MPTKTYSIGEVVRLLSPEFDVSESSLRFWEKTGLITSRRTPGGHRVFTEDDLLRIRTLKQLQTQRRMPLDEIRRLCESGISTEELAAIAAFKETVFRPLRYDPNFEPLTRSQLAERTGLDEATLIALEDVGSLHPVGDGACFDEDGLRVAEIVGELARYGVRPESFQETNALMRQLVELQYRNFFQNVYPNLPREQEADHLKVLHALGQELFRINYHQIFRSVGARLVEEGQFREAQAKKSQKAKTR